VQLNCIYRDCNKYVVLVRVGTEHEKDLPKRSVMSEKRIFRALQQKREGKILKIQSGDVGVWRRGGRNELWAESASAAGLLIADGGLEECCKSGARCPGDYQQWRRGKPRWTPIFHKPRKEAGRGVCTRSPCEGASVANFRMWINWPRKWWAEVSREGSGRRKFTKATNNSDATRGYWKRTDYRTFRHARFPIGPDGIRKCRYLYQETG